MRILIITGNTKPNSGLGRYSKEVIRELRAQNEDVFVLAESGSRDGTLKLSKSGFSFVRNIVTARKWARSADIVHSLDIWPFSIYAFFAVIGSKKTLFANGVGTYSVPPARFSLKRLLMLAAFRRAQHVFCISRYVCERIRGRLPFECSTSIVHLAANLLPKPDPHIVEQLRTQYDLAPDSEIVLTVGAIKDRKGQLDTLQAVIRMRQRRPNLVYVMVGSDSDAEQVSMIRKKAEAHHAEDVYRIVADASSDELLAAWYSMADVFVLASNNAGDHFEGFGLVFLEAGQFGVPGIGTKECGIEDAVADGSTGLLVSQRDPEGIEKAILVVLSNRQHFSANARAFVATFSWHKTVEQYRSIYYS